jgi:5-formyltetrahydrofolate cyclo-ligase
VAIEPTIGSKEALRIEMRRRLLEVHPDSTPLIDSLLKTLNELNQPRNIAIYCALADEPCITSLINTLPKHHWLLPRVDGEKLHFHRVWDPSTQFQTGAFGISEPLSELPVTPSHDIDIFICPGLAFDPRGGRLGRGRGFYDRVLANAREDALKIGVGFACQMIEDTFPEPHDVAMNAVLCHG